MSLLQLALLGALIGLPLGYALQKTNLCFNSAYREAVVHRRTVLLRLIGLAVLIQMVGLAILIQFNIGGVRTNIVPRICCAKWWMPAILDGRPEKVSTNTVSRKARRNYSQKTMRVDGSPTRIVF